MATFGNFEYTSDREATLDAYGKVKSGGPNACQCSECRNWLLVRESVYPEEFRQLLMSLGVDHTKEAEVYGLEEPPKKERSYGGWFHFVGELLNAGDHPTIKFSDTFEAWLQLPTSPALDELGDLPLVQLEFRTTDVPWLLAESE